MNFKKDDFVRVKDGLEIRKSGILTNDTEGVVIDIAGDKITVLFDAKAIQWLIQDEYIHFSLLNLEPYEMVSGEFAEADLTPSSSRYTEEECQEAMDEFMDAKIDYEEGNFYPQETLIMQTMIDKFLDGSDAFKTLSKKEQQAAPSILSDLIQILHDEEMKVVLRTLDDEVLNNIIFSEFLYFYENPTKEFSRTIPRVYAAFFSFLAEINYAVHGKRISEYLKESELVISEAIENPRLWEIFKEAEAAAEAAGLDQSQEAFHDYVQNYIVKHPEFKVKTIQHNQKEIKVIPPPELDTEGLKPGDRITVKYYANGLLKQDVKFKQVQKDLEEGKCKLLRR